MDIRFIWLRPSTPWSVVSLAGFLLVAASRLPLQAEIIINPAIAGQRFAELQLDTFSHGGGPRQEFPFFEAEAPPGFMTFSAGSVVSSNDTGSSGTGTGRAQGSASAVITLADDVLTVQSAASLDTRASFSSSPNPPTRQEGQGFGSGSFSFTLPIRITERPYAYSLSGLVNHAISGGDGEGSDRARARFQFTGGRPGPWLSIDDDHRAGSGMLPVSGSGTLPVGSYSLNLNLDVFAGAHPRVAGTHNADGSFDFQLTLRPAGHWINPAGGSFQVATNWAGEIVPSGPQDVAIFELPGTYTVQLDQNVTNHGIRANGSGVNVTMDLNGLSYTMKRFEAGGKLGDNVSFTFKGGEAPALTAAGPLVAAAPGDGEVVIQDELLIKKDVPMEFNDGVQARFTSGSIDGSLTVADDGTHVNAISVLNVGTNLTGSIAVENGATLQSGFTVLGVDPVLPVLGGGDGSVVVGGQDSKWQLTPGLGLVVGSRGKGSVRVNSGGLVDASLADVTVADERSSTGVVQIVGFGRFKAQNMVVGNEGDGSLVVEQGGTAEAATLTVGGGVDVLGFAGEGDVTVVNPGSTLIAGRIRIGAFLEGQGRVFISNQGELIQNGILGTLVGEKGTLEVRSRGRASATTLLVDRGGDVSVLEGGGLFTNTARVSGIGGGQSTVTVSGLAGTEPARWGVHDRLDIAIGGTVTVGDGGVLVVDSRLNIETDGILQRQGDGTIVVGMSQGTPGTVSVGPGGTLSGSGTLAMGGGTLVISGGAQSVANILPGNSPGMLTIEGNYRQEQFGVLGIEIEGSAKGTQYDVLRVTGNATMGGNLVLKFIDGFAPRQGDAFEFLDAGGTLGGQFAGVAIRNLAPEFQFELRSVGGDMSMVALNDGVFVPPPPSNWNVDAGGNWSAAANWTIDVPDAPGAIAVFGNTITAPRTVSADAPVTLGRINFDSSHTYTVAGSSTVTLQTRSSSEEINVASGSHTISAPVTLADNTVVNVSPAASNLAITGALTANGMNLTKEGAGTLTLNHLRATALSVNAGSLVIAPNGGDPGTSAVDTLTVNGTSRLDLNNNDLVVRATASTKNAVHAAVQADIVTAQNGVDGNFVTKWDGPGVTSTAARTANVGTGFDLVGLGAIRNSDLDIITGLPGSSYTSFSGQPVTPDDVLVKYTYIGDGNLDGVVSFDDYVGIDNAFFGLIPNLGWATGDINFDNLINFDDYSVVDQAFFFQGAPLTQANVATVPEPAAWISLACGLTLALAVRRHTTYRK